MAKIELPQKAAAIILEAANFIERKAKKEKVIAATIAYGSIRSC
jgi:hypothetical protein